jgi:hypothetical protein
MELAGQAMRELIWSRAVIVTSFRSVLWRPQVVRYME